MIYLSYFVQKGDSEEKSKKLFENGEQRWIRCIEQLYGGINVAAVQFGGNVAHMLDLYNLIKEFTSISK